MIKTFVFSLAALSLLSFFESESLASNKTYRVLGFKGNVSFNGKPLARRNLPGRGVLVADGTESFVDLLISEKNRFRLKNGRLRLESLSESGAEVKLEKGRVFASIEPKKPKRFKFRLRTKSATMGIRGTKFFVEEQADASYLCVCEGRVGIESPGGKHVVSEGEDVWDRPGQKLEPPSRASDPMWAAAKEEFGAMGIRIKGKRRAR